MFHDPAHGCCLTVAALLIAAACGAPSRQPADPIAAMTPADLAHGRRLFESQCADCHGATGEGGRGANLAVPHLKYAPDNAALFRVIMSGIDGTEMPAVRGFADRDVWHVAGYVRTLGRTAAVTLPGNARRGEKLYASLQCASCHTINAQGGTLGPDLTGVGVRRNAMFLRDCLVDPAKTLPENFVMIRARTLNGREVRGIRVNEDTFTIQIKSLDGQFSSFRKTALASLDKLQETPMPSYRGRLFGPNLDDLVAYLASLRGGL